MDEQRALLDSLMGFNRDGDRPDEATLDFRHARVCKPWLCGLCPRQLFQNTRLDAGGCELLHIPHLRAAYEEQHRRDFGYERDLATELSQLLGDVEKKIARGKKRLDEDGDGQEEDESLERTQLLRRRLRRQSGLAGNAVDANQKLRVCDVCGAFLSIFDSDQRLADHFGGKVHVGYVQIRAKLKELQKRKETPLQQERPRRREEDRHRGERRERSRCRERHRRRSSSSSRDRKRRRGR